jgi:hypothetical protein
VLGLSNEGGRGITYVRVGGARRCDKGGKQRGKTSRVQAQGKAAADGMGWVQVRGSGIQPKKLTIFYRGLVESVLRDGW